MIGKTLLPFKIPSLANKCQYSFHPIMRRKWYDSFYIGMATSIMVWHAMAALTYGQMAPFDKLKFDMAAFVNFFFDMAACVKKMFDVAAFDK